MMPNDRARSDSSSSYDRKTLLECLVGLAFAVLLRHALVMLHQCAFLHLQMAQHMP